MSIKHLTGRSKEEIISNASKKGNVYELWNMGNRYHIEELIITALDKGETMLDSKMSGKIFGALNTQNEWLALILLKHAQGIELLKTSKIVSKRGKNIIYKVGKNAFRLSMIYNAVYKGMIHLTKYLLSSSLFSKKEIEHVYFKINSNIKIKDKSIHPDSLLCFDLLEEYLEKNVNESIKHLTPKTPEELEKIKQQIIKDAKKLEDPNQIYRLALEFTSPDLVKLALDKGLELLDRTGAGLFWAAWNENREWEVLAMMQHPKGDELMLTNPGIRETALWKTLYMGYDEVLKYMLSKNYLTHKNLRDGVRRVQAEGYQWSNYSKCIEIIEEYIGEKLPHIYESIKHLTPKSKEEIEKLLPEMEDTFYEYLDKHFPYEYVHFPNSELHQLSQDFGLSIQKVKQCIENHFKARRQAERFNEAFNYHTTYLQIYKNNDQKDYYNYIVFKGNDLFYARVVSGEHLAWKYQGKIDKNKYNVNGLLISKPHIKLIALFQNKLKAL